MSKKLSMQEMGLDDELNIPEFNFDQPPVEDNRSPSTKLADSIKHGAKATLSNPAVLGNVIKRTLPKEYGEAIGAVQDVSKTVRQTYEDAVDTVKPAAGELAKSVEKMVPDSAKRTKALLNKVAKWGTPDAYDKGPSVDQQRQTNMNIELDAMFAQRDKESQKEQILNDSRDKVQQGLEILRHRDQMTALNAISIDLSSINQYTNRITSAFQRKSLELQYRSFYVQADLLKETREAAAITKSRLDSINKNTGLPDYVKLHNSERLGETLRNQFADSLVGGLTGGRNDFIRKLGETARGRIMDTGRAAAQAMSMGAMGADMYNTFDDLDSFTGGPKRGMAEKGGSAATSWAIEKMAYNMAAKGREKMLSVEPVAKGAAWLGDKANNGITDANEWRQKDGGEDESVFKKLGRGILNFVWPNMRPNTGLQKDQMDQGRNAAVFNNFTNKSITEVIPGYLSRILREVYVLRTGDTEAKLMSYDHSKNKFANSDVYTKAIKDRLVPQARKQAMSSDILEKLAEVEEAAGSNFTDEERQKIAELMLTSSLNQRTGGASRMANRDTFSHLDLGRGGADRVAGMFGKYFEVDGEGKVAGTAEAMRRESNFKTWHQNLPEGLEDIRSYMQDLVNAGQLDELRESGFLTENDDLDMDKLSRAYIDMGKSGGDDPWRLIRRKHGPKEAALDSKKKFPETGKRKSRFPNNVTPPEKTDPVRFPRSDVTLKENIKKFQPNKALDALKGIGVSAWNYKLGGKGDDGGMQHYGPMAQDVNKSLGDDFAPDGKKIDLVNMNGMTMQAIKDVDAKVDNNPLMPLTQMIVEKLKVSNEKLANIEALSALTARGGLGLKFKGGKKQTTDLRLALEKLANAGNGQTAALSVETKLMKMLGLGGSIAYDGASAAGSMIGDVHEKAKGHIRKGWTGLKDATSWGKGKVGKYTKMGIDRAKGIADVYFGDEAFPRLTKARLQAGEYFDQKSGQVISTFKDIKGTIVDKDGNIILSTEEIKGAFLKMTVVGHAMKLTDWVGNKLVQIHESGTSHMATLRRTALRGLRSAFDFAGDTLDQPRDVYVKGEKKPRLIAVLMKGGRYANEDGKPINRPSDIKGAVLDTKTNRYLITDEDLKKGLVDEKGEKLQTPLAKLVGMGVAGVSRVFDVFKDIHRNGLKGLQGLVGVGKDAWAGVMNALSHGLGFGRALPVLEQIRDILDKRLPTSKKMLGDLDGDGKRDNGWQSKQDKLDQAKKADGEKRAGKKGEGPRKYETKNTFDLIAEKAAAAKDGIMGALGGGDGGIDIDIDGKDDKKGKGKQSKAQRRADAVRRAEAKAKQAARAEKIANLKNRVKSLPGAGKIGQAASAVGNVASKLPGASTVGSLASKLPSLATIGTGAAAAGTAAGAMGRGALTTLGKPYGGLRLAGQGLMGGAKLAGKGAMLAGRGLMGAGALVGGAAKLGMRALPGLGLGYGLYSGYNDIKDGNYGSAAMNLGLAGLSGATMVGGLGAAGALATGVLGAIFSPIVLGALGAAAVGYAGYKLYKWATKRSYNEISLLRMVQYGMLQGDEPYHQKVGALEDMLQGMVSYDKDGVASLEEKQFDLRKLMDVFELEDSDENGKDRLSQWVQNRFKPVFLTHLTAAKKLEIEGGINGSDKAPVAKKIKMLDLVAMPEGPWEFRMGPFKDLSRLQAGTETVAAVVSALRAKYAKEQKENPEKPQDALKEEAKMTAALSATAAIDRASVNKLDQIPTNTASAKADAIAQKQDAAISNAVRKIGPAGATMVAASEGAKQMATVTSDPGEKYMGGGVSALEAVRLKAYGLMEMDAQRVIAIRSLEAMVGGEIKVGADYSASWTGDLVALVKKARKFFIMGSSDEGQTATWTEWFLKRFLPVFTAYLGGLFQLTLKNKQEAAEASMTANRAVMLAGKLIALSGPWRVTACPWKDYVMCMDTKHTEPNVAYLKEQATSERLREEQAKKQGPAPAALPAAKFSATQDDAAKRAESAIADAKAAAMEEDLGASDETEDPVKGSGGTATVSFANSGGAVPQMAAGERANGSGADRYMKVDKGETLDGVNPELLRLFRGMVQEYGEKTGKTVIIGAGKRTYDMQAALYKKNPKKAAKPGSSLHEVGLAIDASSADLNEMEKLGLFKKYGLTRPVGGEPWHVEPAGIQTDIAGNRADPTKASAAIIAGEGRGGGGWGTMESAVKYTRNPELAKSLLDKPADVMEAKTPAANAAAVAAAKPEGAKPTAKTGTPVTQVASAEAEPGMRGGAGGGGSTGITAQPRAGDAAQNLRDTVPGAGEGVGAMAQPGKGQGWKAMSGTISDAATLAGVDKSEMASIAAIESGFNPNARNKKSSATGLYQFTDDTWNDMMRKYATKYKIDPNTPATDPRANALMGGLFLRDNKKALSKIKSNPNGTDGYIAHFMGLAGAQRFLGMPDGATPAESMPKQAKANQEIFYKPDGKPRTKAEMYALFDKKVKTANQKHGVSFDGETTQPATQMAETPAAAVPASGFMKTSFNPSTLDETKPAIAVPSEVPMGQRSPVDVLARVTQPAAPKPKRREVEQIDRQREEVFNALGSVQDILAKSLGVQTEIRDGIKNLNERMDKVDAQAKKDPGVQTAAPDPKVSSPAPVTSYKPNREPVPMSRAAVSMQHQRQT